MTGYRNLFTKLVKKNCDDISFGDNYKGTVGGNPRIENVLLLKGLKFNLISVNKLYDKKWMLPLTKRM